MRHKEEQIYFVLDPRAQALDRYATKSLNFYPGSDVSLLNAILNVIIFEKLYDIEYVKNHTEGFEQLSETIKFYTPEAMSPICGIAAEDIRFCCSKILSSECWYNFWAWAYPNILTELIILDVLFLWLY